MDGSAFGIHNGAALFMREDSCFPASANHSCCWVHERKKPFNYNFCDSNFTQKDNMKPWHQLMKDKTFKCSACDASFTNNWV